MTSSPRWKTFVVLAALTAAIVGPACALRRVDLGENIPGEGTSLQTLPDGSLVKSQYGCDEWIDDEMSALRTGACGGTCKESGGDSYELESKKALMAATAGQWFFCSGSLGPEGALGVEFAPGCRLYFLRYDQNGNVVRGTEAIYQARYDIYEPRPKDTPRRIDIHLDEERTVMFDVTASRCPEHLQLQSKDQLVDLAPHAPNTGRPDPTK